MLLFVFLLCLDVCCVLCCLVMFGVCVCWLLVGRWLCVVSCPSFIVLVRVVCCAFFVTRCLMFVFVFVFPPPFFFVCVAGCLLVVGCS